MRASLSTLLVLLLPAAAWADASVTPAAEEPARPPPAQATVRHVPPAEAQGDRELRLIALIDDAWVERTLVARYRPLGGRGAWRETPFERSSAGGYFAVIPPEDVQRPGVEYYIAGVGRDGRERDHFASADAPHAVRIEPPAELRWVEAEQRRLDDRRSRVRLALDGQDFGGINGRADRFARGEIDWTHRLIGTLYSFTLGFGFLEGTTPSGLDAAAIELDRGVRYGYGGIKLRLHRAIWVDGRAVMGFGKQGFVAGVGGNLVLGQDWKSCVKVGAETIEELGSSAWVRLQWDTVPHLLMGATATVTDLPGASVASGSYITWDVAFPLSDQLTLAGSLSFGARGNRPGGFGAGLATVYEF